MLVNLSLDLRRTSVAYVAALVLGIVLVMSPSALPPQEWLLPALGCLAAAARPRERGHR